MSKGQKTIGAGSLLGAILDLGKAMIVCGGEVWRVEETLGTICETYCFKEHDILVMSCGIQATVQTWDGRIYTQVRSIHETSRDLDKLKRLFSLAVEINEKPLGVNVLRDRIYEIIESPGIPWWRCIAGSVIAACGFCVFYNGDLPDVIATAFVAAAVYQISRHAMNLLRNNLTANVFSAFAMEIIILLLAKTGLAHHTGPMTIAVMFLLISGLGFTSGFRDLLHGDALSGILETTYALLGAVGIATGITLAMLVIPGMNESIEVQVYVSDMTVQMLSCTVGCIGFAVLFGARGRTMLYSAAGAAVTWGIFQLTFNFTIDSLFLATLAGSAFVAFYSVLLERIRNLPAIVTFTACIFPMIPGSNLYYTVLGAILHDAGQFRAQGLRLLLICIAISIGFIIVDVAQKYLHYLEIEIDKRQSAKKKQVSD